MSQTILMNRRSIAVGALATLALSVGALAAPKKVDGLSKLGVVPGKPGGAYTLVLDDSPATFLYYAAIDANQQALAQQMFDTLVEFNLSNYKIEPGLAESWTITEGGRVYTFKLRQGVKWSDGQDFDADDVVFTYENMVMNPEAKAGDAGNFDIGGQKVKIEKLDRYTVRMTLAKASPAFLLQQRYFILPRHKLLKSTVAGGAKAADINAAWPTTTAPADIVGTGPFRLQAYTPGQKVTLTRNPNYWKVDANGTRLPYLDRLEFVIARDPSAQQALFQAKAVDSLNITGAQFPAFKLREASGNYKVVRAEALFGRSPHLALNFNDKDPALAKVFSDLRFRTAVQGAVNRERIIDNVYNFLATLPGHGMPPVSSLYFDTTRYLGKYDPKAAAGALDAMGLKDTDGDGVRNLSASKPLEFDLTYGTDSPVYPAMATILQNDLRQIGVKVNLKGVLERNLLTVGTSGDFSALLFGFGDQPDPELRKPIWQPGGSLYYWHRATQPSTPNGEPNFAKMASWEKTIYDLFEKAAVETDDDKREALYGRWQISFARNLPVIMLVKPMNIAAISNRFGNFVYNLGVIPGYNPVPLIYEK